MEQRNRNQGTGEVPVAFLLKSLLFSYILTGVMLALLAFLLYRFGLGERAVSIAIIVIYVVATLFSGFMAGKRIKSRRFLWGLVMGGAYFLVLAVVSLIAGKGDVQIGSSFFTTLALCAGGGMLGGMLS
ncbi:MAG: TIGR04086 family membrane protein [Lachnospiraceae bacterium]|jgi:putative membrane protein (TIGR04086 family)|nr:TIGR04086 family membrane protein [uncultured Acetatifactor sp.]MCI9218709.1 TIGR04086 family membrane protein [Lachnospiraceae bacterium]